MPESICGAGKTLLAANQIHSAGHIVDDVPRKFGGSQQITLFEGPTIPLVYKDSLCQMKNSCPTDQ